jgi:hypothetical protein
MTTMTRIKPSMVGATLILTLVLAACATATDASGPSDDADPAAGMCPQDQPDCIDTPQLADDEPVTIGEEGVEQLRRDARFYLGLPQDDLNELVRIGRIGDEHMALTDDYVVGRITVELDEVDGRAIVTSSTVELPDGPETFDLDR